MIDLHFHCLPGIDDGPADWTEAVALCRAAEAAGTTGIVATPHVFRGPWQNEDRAARNALVDELNRRLGGTPRVFPGCEVMYFEGLVEAADQGKRGPLQTLGGSRYLLVEFMPGYVPPSVEASFHELWILGMTPVIAHPERNLVLAAEPERLGALVEAGAVVQLTAGSLTGQFGPGALRAAEHFLRVGIAQLVASDAHSTDVRPPGLGKAREKVRWLGEEAVHGIFEANPAAVLVGGDLPWGGRA